LGERLEEAGIVPSMGRTGTALDNAMAESFVATLKTELVHRRRFPDREAAKSAICRVPGRVLQPASAALGTRLPEPAAYEEATMKEVAVA
jgi:putative transposase